MSHDHICLLTTTMYIPVPAYAHVYFADSQHTFVSSQLIALLHYICMQCYYMLSTAQGGWTPLMTAAALEGRCDVVIELLHNGADIDAQNNVSHINTVTVMSKYLTSAILLPQAVVLSGGSMELY